MLSILFRNLRFTIQEQLMGATYLSIMERLKSEKVCAIEPDGMFKDEDIDLDVQELSERSPKV